jgi:hypothetical protein
MAMVFLYMEKPLTLHGLILSQLQFLASIMKLISSFLTENSKSSGRGQNVHTPENMSKDTTRFCPVPHPLQYYINDPPKIPEST